MEAEAQLLELIAELPPGKSRQKLIERARELAERADSIDIPDAPLGAPAISSPMAATIIRLLLPRPPRVIAHLRLLDVNMLGAINIAYGLSAVGVDRLLLLRGDAPSLGDPCEAAPEDVAREVRARVRDVRVGHLLSLAKPWEQVSSRIASGADFYLVTRPWRSPRVAEAAREAHARGSELYIYLVVITEANAGLLSRLPREELASPGEVREAVRLLASRGVDGVVVSSPGDFSSLLSALEVAREAIS